MVRAKFPLHFLVISNMQLWVTVAIKSLNYEFTPHTESEQLSSSHLLVRIVFQVVTRIFHVRGEIDDLDAISNFERMSNTRELSSCNSPSFQFLRHLLLLVLDVHVLGVDHAFVFLLTLACAIRSRLRTSSR
jgi:hypothetical protein